MVSLLSLRRKEDLREIGMQTPMIHINLKRYIKYEVVITIRKKGKSLIVRPRKDEIGHLKPIPSCVLKEEILTGTVVDEYHDHNADPVEHERKGDKKMMK